MRRAKLLLFLVIHSLTFSNGFQGGAYGGMGGGMSMGIGFPSTNPDGNFELQDNPMTVEMLASNFSFITSNGLEDAVKAEAVKNFIKMNKLDESKNQLLFDKVLNRTYEKLAMKEINWKYDEKSGLMTYEGYLENNSFENLTGILDKVNISQPSGYTDAYLLKEARDNATTPQEYFSELKKRFSPESEAYAKALKDGFYNFKVNSDDSKLFIQEMVKGEIDQNFLGSLLQGQLYLNSANLKGIDGLTELIAQYYDFNTPLLMGENILCSQVMVKKYSMEYKEQGYDMQAGFGGDNDEESKLQLQEFQKKQDQAMIDNIAKLISLGADTNITCLNGQSVTDIIEDFRDAEIIDQYDLQFNTVPMSTPCPDKVDTSDLLALCDVAMATSTFSNQINQNDRLIPKVKSKSATLIYVKGEEKCHFKLLDKIVQGINGQSTREISLTVSENSTKDEITLSGKSKKDFLEKLNALIK